MTYPVGSIVLWERQPGTDPIPSVVTHDWGDGTVQLFVMDFQGPHGCRAVPVTALIPVDLHGNRIARLEIEVANLTAELRLLEASLGGRQPEPETITATSEPESKKRFW